MTAPPCYGITSALDELGTRNAASRIYDCFRCLRVHSALSCIELVRFIAGAILHNVNETVIWEKLGFLFDDKGHRGEDDRDLICIFYRGQRWRRFSSS